MDEIIKILEEYRSRCGVHSNSREEDEARITRIDNALRTANMVQKAIDQFCDNCQTYWDRPRTIVQTFLDALEKSFTHGNV